MSSIASPTQEHFSFSQRGPWLTIYIVDNLRIEPHHTPNDVRDIQPVDTDGFSSNQGQLAAHTGSHNSLSIPYRSPIEQSDNHVTDASVTQYETLAEHKIPTSLIDVKIPQLAALIRFYHRSSSTRPSFFSNVRISVLPGVLTASSVDMILQYLYTDWIPKCSEVAPYTEISRLIEMARLNDYWLIHDKALEEGIAKKIKKVILGHAVEELHVYVHEKVYRTKGPYDTLPVWEGNLKQTGDLMVAYRRLTKPNTKLLNIEHIDQASTLRRGHPIQMLFIEAAVEEYVADCEDQAFLNRLGKKMPWLTEELMRMVKKVFHDSILSRKTRELYFNDPFSGKVIVAPRMEWGFLGID
jgi:hypothetical protein